MMDDETTTIWNELPLDISRKIILDHYCKKSKYIKHYTGSIIDDFFDTAKKGESFHYEISSEDARNEFKVFLMYVKNNNRVCVHFMKRVLDENECFEELSKNNWIKLDMIDVIRNTFENGFINILDMLKIYKMPTPTVNKKIFYTHRTDIQYIPFSLDSID